MLFFYLKYEMSRGNKPKVGRLVYDVRQTEVYYRPFPQSAQDQRNDFYTGAAELLLPNNLKPRVSSMKTRTYLHADRDGNLETRMSHTGI